MGLWQKIVHSPPPMLSPPSRGSTLAGGHCIPRALGALKSERGYRGRRQGARFFVCEAGTFWRPVGTLGSRPGWPSEPSEKPCKHGVTCVMMRTPSGALDLGMGGAPEVYRCTPTQSAPALRNQPGSRCDPKAVFVVKLVPSKLKLAKAEPMRRGLGAMGNVSVILPELRSGIVCLPRDPEELWERWQAEQDSSEYPDNSACTKVRAHLFGPIPLDP